MKITSRYDSSRSAMLAVSESGRPLIILISNQFDRVTAFNENILIFGYENVINDTNVKD